MNETAAGQLDLLSQLIVNLQMGSGATPLAV
jgi:hypothetical protein